MGQKFSDGARTELSTSITAAQTTINVVYGTEFPEVTAGAASVSDNNTWFKLVIQDTDYFEIVYVRTHDLTNSPNVFSNVLRGQDGTTARAFAAQTVVGLRPTAADMDKAINGRLPLNGTAQNANYAGRASLLHEARRINGTPFDASADIETGYWGAGRYLTVGNCVRGVNGTGDVVWNLGEMGAVQAGGGVGQSYSQVKIGWASLNSGRSGLQVQVDASDFGNWWPINVDGESRAAARLSIGRSLKVGSTGKAFDGSADVEWSLWEIGAAATSHRHGYNDLEYRPVEQGTGEHQGGNAIRIGWAAPSAGLNESALLLQVDASNFMNYWPIHINGSANTAHSLSSARAFTIGNSAKAFNGGSNVAWTLAEIGASPVGHNHAWESIQPTAIELGAAAPNQYPYIDFHSSPNALVDFDARIACDGGDGVNNGQGNLQYNARNHVFTGWSTFNQGISTSTMTIGKPNTESQIRFEGITQYMYANSSAVGIYNAANGMNIAFQPDGKVVAREFYGDHIAAGSFATGNWFRSTGVSGWMNDTYGGGWYMEDAAWMRVWGNRNIFCGAEIAATGNITAYYSDERLKENKVAISGALGKVKALTGYHYNANELAASFGYDTTKAEVGLLAQDVQKVMPQVVEQAPFDRTDIAGESKTGENYLTLKYERLVPLLVEAIKEQDANQTALMARLEKMEAANETLMCRLDQLKGSR
jgi:hypothetical protein